VDDKWDKVAALDLKSVRNKFAFKKGWWWRTRNDALRVEAEYRRFLYLIISNVGQTVVPWSRDLDDFWHEHILDTAKYDRDCAAIFGRFIHHNPHLPEGSPAHTKSSAATRQMYKKAFKDSASKGRRRTHSDIGCGSDMPVVFCDSTTHAGHHGCHDAGGHHGGSHGCGSHSSGHGCGGHGCGGHGCGGHGCGGGGH